MKKMKERLRRHINKKLDDDCLKTKKREKVETKKKYVNKLIYGLLLPSVIDSIRSAVSNSKNILLIASLLLRLQTRRECVIIIILKPMATQRKEKNKENTRKSKRKASDCS